MNFKTCPNCQKAVNYDHDGVINGSWYCSECEWQE